MLHFYILFLCFFVPIQANQDSLLSAGSKRASESTDPQPKRIHFQDSLLSAGTKRAPERDELGQEPSAQAARMDNASVERVRKIEYYARIEDTIESNLVIVNALEREYNLARAQYLARRLSLPVPQEFCDRMQRAHKKWKTAHHNLIRPYQITLDQLREELWPTGRFA